MHRDNPTFMLIIAILVVIFLPPLHRLWWMWRTKTYHCWRYGHTPVFEASKNRWNCQRCGRVLKLAPDKEDS